MKVDDKLFLDMVRELDLYVEIMVNLLTDSQLDHVSTIGSMLVSTGDVPSGVKLRDRMDMTARLRDEAAKLLTSGILSKLEEVKE